MNIDNILRGYVVCALWSSTDHDGEPMDDGRDVSDLAPATLVQMREDVTDFVQANEATLVASGQSEEQIGHDFWLTRNGHGAGFWDRGLGAIGDQLTEACKTYAGVDLYVGDDGLIYN
jgi:hypothetical protein